ncbi:MAG: hypothetical protein IPH60_04740 [Flavobacteriales bacterium]|nr:hypothetical protein [Flavobacteriales bacterium]
MVEVRTRELATEKERSDALLRNILPASTAEELKQHGAAKRRYDACTVLFSDFKDFTNFSSAMDSDTLVSELDHHFRLFDQLTDTFGLRRSRPSAMRTCAPAGSRNLHRPMPRTHCSWAWAC